MISGILVFFLFLGPLVFFHELGHFLFARLCGVRVETFSIGFGPKLFKWKRGDTVYAFSAIPLGGYVKMFGDDPLAKDELSEEDKKVAYTHKSKWQRFWIVFGGPLANFVMAFVLYFFLAVDGEKVPEPKLGVIKADSKFYSLGLRTGDVLKKLNDKKIYNFDDVNIADSQINTMIIGRGGEEVKIETQISTGDFQTNLLTSVTQLKAPIYVNANGESFLVGNENGIVVSIEELSQLKGGDTVTIQKIESDVSKLGVWDPENAPLKLSSSQNATLDENADDINGALRALGYYPRELMVNKVTADSAAKEAGIAAGDIIVGFENSEVSSFIDFKNMVQDLKEPKEITLSVLSPRGLRTVELTPKETVYNEKKVLLVGIESGIIGFGKMVEFQADGILSGLSIAFKRTIDGTVNVVGMFKKLIFGEVSVNNLGGPIAIGKAANDYFDLGLSMFLRLMALISINLAVINLFPIPVLDGGHIVFILFELVNGGPLSRKKLLYAQQFGMSLLFLLIFVAVFNDIKRFLL